MSEHPKSIAKYQILDLLGRGAMGTVYLAHDPFIDRKVAIKVCVLDQTGDPEQDKLSHRMFFNEAQAAGALDHPNILHIYDAGESGGEPYIAMEYVEGAKTLQGHCKPDMLLPVASVVRLMFQSAKALDYAHRRGVVHRDIKPANLMITEDGDVKIGDFGIAQRLQSDKTQLMGTFGSPLYMSPEQVSDEPVGPLTDLYSLGVVMYELLVGEPPYQARGLANLISKIVTEPTPSTRQKRPEVPESVDRIVTRAMEKHAVKRYQSGAEMAADLARVFTELNRKPSELSDEEKFKAARSLTFFNEFSDAELQEVLDVSTWIHFSGGRKVIEEGKQEQSFYVIAYGDASVSIGGRTIARLGKGDCLGELGYLSKTQRTATVTTVSDSLLLRVDAELMEWASIPCQMRFNKTFQATLIERLRRTSRELAKHLS